MLQSISRICNKQKHHRIAAYNTV